ncbi:hypothetical protein A2291_03740 [candidate division WOR-1 bacterium RIFOXYB2_FULL_42_35]|uniref:GH26 domain-containing protein n=1 Tax=candidate division WOR-1 bacterium RIFOXYC2_FULL_41_25 TaxID=1802586 RepID=A0A1F4TQR2_UNCSA|nr:MAG: hypothetical protein A2247_03310 [candidate division WOR-1 bacterium RIFOXYA2_FULL_41_14]OGC25574.1 MAG: hypothetical protein A2291_03740 [candidate division WOR-1 bacterium RIFOXYB2_FULL_42_35]OGC35006.1 MAG: hypothetical protein A2462_05370 [candidate division WOR-1 bacterium RIFOXYC2_FULL_41_25]OGC44200.1 MAG: hypothetical protein A2548_02880 [candidate division WOR-1 bacterium RIFOXYD2_FULL_41_8]
MVGGYSVVLELNMDINPYQRLKTANYKGCAIGAFVNGASNLASFQTTIDKNLAIVHTYVHWPASALRATAGKQDLLPVEELNAVYNNGSIPLLTWEPWVTNQQGVLAAIASGQYDGYVRAFIQAAKDTNKPLFLRFAHEMNGNWYPWDGFHNGSAAGPAKYKQAWSYIYSVIQELQADNIILVWSPNNNNLPDEVWNNMADYYPGDDYVDWLAVDGYNWGYANWESFEQIFGAAYTKLLSISNKPIMVAEFASATGEGNSKADWITDALSKIKNSYPLVKAFCWFNVNKERDWRVNSSSASEAAFRNALKESYFLDRIEH